MVEWKLFTFSISPCDGEMVEWTLVMFAISPCDGEMVKLLKKVSIVTLLVLRLASHSSSSVSVLTLLTACKIFSLDNGAWLVLL